MKKNRLIAFIVFLNLLMFAFAASVGAMKPLHAVLCAAIVLQTGGLSISGSLTAQSRALTLISLTGFQRGIASNEVGINCSRFSLEIEPEINEWLPGIDGQARGKAVGDPMGKLTIEGEINSALGVMAATFVAAFVPTNTVSYFGRSAGGFYMDRAVVDQERDGWKKLSAEFSSRFAVA